jgi:hypothetical protein
LTLYPETRGSIRLLAADLYVGDTASNILCPFCGVQHEKKFSITRTEGGLLYNCYRAKCGESGFVPDEGAWIQRTKPDVPVDRPYIQKLYPIEDIDVEFFEHHFGISTSYIRQIRLTEDGRYALPLFSPQGARRGWCIRQPVWSGLPQIRGAVPGMPKAQTYKDRAYYPNTGWSRTAPQIRPKIVLTEDVFSAAKVAAAGYTTVSLQGISLSYDGAKEIKQADPLFVAIWLDPGAESAAYRLLDKWGLTFNYTCVIVGDKDPKYYSKDEIEEKLSVIRW